MIVVVYFFSSRRQELVDGRLTEALEASALADKYRTELTAAKSKLASAAYTSKVMQRRIEEEESKSGELRLQLEDAERVRTPAVFPID